MSAIPVLGREVTVTVDGKPWTIARMEVDVLDRFIDWVKTQLPPVGAFEGFDKIIPHLPPEEALKLIKEERARVDGYMILDFMSPMVNKYLESPRGVIHLLLLMLQVHHPEATLNDAMRVFKQVGSAGLAKLLAEARGEFRQGKAEAPATANGLTGAISAGA